jgi:hypothetical protein
MSLTFVNGHKGRRSKADVRLSVARTPFTVAGVDISVWEGDKITHSFYPDAEFIRAFIREGTRYLEHQDELMKGEQARQERLAATGQKGA